MGKPLRLISGLRYIPKDINTNPKGEDAYFTCDARNTFGVADGVGGWARWGIDASEYARLLMENSALAVYREPKGAVDPKRVLNQAYQKTKVPGSSTACIVTLWGNHLVAANVGDSGFFLFRDKEIIYRSPVQQHGFNFPYQLGWVNGCDKPDVALEMSIPVKAGDIVVLGTDGLLDNMCASEIAEIVDETTGRICPNELASAIAEKAVNNAHDDNHISPFEVAATLAGLDHIGGKVDDITVVVGLIEDQ